MTACHQALFPQISVQTGQLAAKSHVGAFAQFTLVQEVWVTINPG